MALIGNVADFKTPAIGWENEVKVIRAKYNFALDTGAIGTYNLLTAGEDMIVLESCVNVKTAFTGASSSYKIGTTSDDDAILAATAVASMTVGVKDGASASKRLKLAKDEEIILDISAGAATAGELEVVLICIKA